MSIEVSKPHSGEVVDHINGDKLDNRRANLRNCLRVQNTWNQGISRNNTSGYKGVQRSGRRWVARIGIGNTRVHLGVFDSARDAATAYNQAAFKAWGRFARLNET